MYHRRLFVFLLHPPLSPLPPPTPTQRSISKPFNINVHFRGEIRIKPEQSAIQRGGPGSERAEFNFSFRVFVLLVRGGFK